MPSVLITGAARGLGRELFEAYRRRAWTLFPLVRKREDAEALAAEGCHPILGDVGSGEIEGVITRVLAMHVDSLDLLINNAGHVKKLRWIPETSAEDIEELVRVHCAGAFRCTHAALPFLRKAVAPTVINISSRFGSVARVVEGEFRGIYSYSIAKAAENMLTACLDQELRRDGVRAFALHPGRLKTAVGAVDADTDPAVAAEKLADFVASIPRDAPCALYDVMSGTVIPW